MNVIYLEDYSDVGVATDEQEPEIDIYEDVGNVEDRAGQRFVATKKTSKFHQ
jgi:hypothetical protein